MIVMEDKFEYEIVGDTLIIKSGEKVPNYAFYKYAFYSNKKIRKVCFECEIKVIGESAFASRCDIGNEYLNKIILNNGFDNGFENINYDAFFNCELEEITIPFTVKEMGKDAFKNNPLKRVYLYEGSLISKLSKEKLDKIFGGKAEIIIKPRPNVKMPSKEEIDNRFNNVSDEDRKRYGKELLELISKDDYVENTDNLNKVKELLLKGADTEVVDEYINTGLMICIKKNLISTFNMYMLCKCNIFHRNKLGDDVLITCSRYNRNDMADILIDRGCIINGINKLDETALSIAYENNNSYLINKLESILGIVKEESLEEKAKRLLKEYSSYGR